MAAEATQVYKRVDTTKRVVTIYISAHGAELIDQPLRRKKKISKMLDNTFILSMAGATGTIGLGLGTSRSVFNPRQSITEHEMETCYNEFIPHQRIPTSAIMKKLSFDFKKQKLKENEALEVPLEAKLIQKPHKPMLRSSVQEDEYDDEDEYEEEYDEEDDDDTGSVSLVDSGSEEEDLEDTDVDILLVGSSVIKGTYCDLIKPIYNRLFQLGPNDDEDEAFRVHYGIHLVDIRGMGDDQRIYSMRERGLDYNNITHENPHMCPFGKEWYDYFIEKKFLEKQKEQAKQDKKDHVAIPTKVLKDKFIPSITLYEILEYVSMRGVDVLNIIDPSCRSVDEMELIDILDGRKRRVTKDERKITLHSRAGTKHRLSTRKKGTKKHSRSTKHNCSKKCCKVKR